MIEDPEVHASGSSQNPNSSLDHSTSSPPSRDRCVAQVAEAARKSSAKSRLETASIEFSATDANLSSRATISRSVSKLTPARAPAPSGITAAAPDTAANRSRSRTSIHTYASR